MWQDNIYLNLGESIKVDGRYYTVEGAIQFQNIDNPSGWTEYKLIGERDYKVAWLSVDNTYTEYALYHESLNNTGFDEVRMVAEGYKRVEFEQAEVVAVRGPIDVEVRDRVRYETYEDKTEEKIMSIEVWDDGIEYATGYYIDAGEVQRLGTKPSNDEGYRAKQTSYMNSGVGKSLFQGINLKYVAAIIAIILMAGVVVFNGGQSKKTVIRDYLDKTTGYSYVTSITSDLQPKQKARVYKTSYTVDEATKKIIDAAYNHIEEVQDSKEDGSSVIMTKEEYCLIYTSEDNQTFIQVSSRKYAYSSTNSPYRARLGTYMFYRNYYYSRGYTRDRGRYKSYASGYTNHTEAFASSDGKGTYTPYVSSVRQSSAASRASSGGGTSSGK